MSRVIFITGATSGFGRATAERFAREGWKVIATGRRLERLEALRKELGADSVHIAQMDLMDRESIVAAIESIPDDFKPVTCLCNNGGLARGTQPVPDIDLNDWEEMIETNIKGLIHTTQEMIPLLKEAGKGASIINIGSVAANFQYPGGNVYGATKAFVRQFSYMLRTDLRDTDIRVTDLEPGMAKTEFTTVRTHGNEKANEDFYKGADPLRAEDIAETVWWLANRPPNVNVNAIEIMAQCQTPAGFHIRRDG